LQIVRLCLVIDVRVAAAGGKQPDLDRLLVTFQLAKQDFAPMNARPKQGTCDRCFHGAKTQRRPAVVGRVANYFYASIPTRAQIHLISLPASPTTAT
jgi:hypothetical protein